MMTGHDFSENNPQPHTGSVISRVFGPKGDLPASIVLPVKIGNTGASTPHGQAGAYLGSAHEPFFLNADPAQKDFQVANLLPPKGLSDFRVQSRRQLLGELDALQRRAESKSVLDHDTAYNRAFNLLTSPGTKKAFDLTQEPDALARSLWAQHLRPELPDGSPADRARDALRDGQPLRHGVQHLVLGHARRRRRTR